MGDYDKDSYDTYHAHQNDANLGQQHANNYWHNPSQHWETEAQINRGAEIQQQIDTNDYGSPRGYERWRETGGFTSPSQTSSTGGSGSGGSCFVATACFENADHPTVTFLRGYRDDKLVKSKIGQAFVACYWEIGPKLARLVDKIPVVKPMLRTALTHLSMKISDHYAGQIKPLDRAALGSKPVTTPAGLKPEVK